MKILVSALLYLLLFFIPSSAVILHVPEQYETIDQAILEAIEGDTVLAAPGIYPGHIDFWGKAIVVASNYIIDSSLNSITGTIICGSGRMHPDTGTIVTFQSGEKRSSVLTGFTIRAGFGTLIADNYIGGGILCMNNSNPLICNNIIRDNNAISGGGCAFLDSDPEFCYNQVLNNNAVRGGGAYLDNSRAVMDHNLFAYNSATEDGGGIYILLCDNPVIKNSVIYNNSSATVGGISCFFSYPDISFNDLYNNQEANFGDCGEGFGDTLACLNFNLIPSDSSFNFSRDPMFRDPVNGDFYPLGNSLLIDAGSDYNPEFPWNGLRTDIGLYEVQYLVGDANSDNEYNITDVVFLIKYVFQGGVVPEPFYSGDFNCDRKVNLVDIVQMINYIFQDGMGPCANFEWQPQCGK